MSQPPLPTNMPTPPSGVPPVRPQTPMSAYSPPAAQKPQEMTITPILVGIYMILLSIVTLCSSMLILGCGGILGDVGGFLSSASRFAENSAGDVFGQFGFETTRPVDVPDVGGVVNLGAIVVIMLGVVSLILAIALLVNAIGLLLTRGWAYLVAIVLNAGYIFLQIVGAILGGLVGSAIGIGGGLNILQIVLIILSGLAIVFLIIDGKSRKVFSLSR